MTLAHLRSSLAACLLATAYAQSPPNFEPSSSNPLSLAFNGVQVSSGQRLPLSVPTSTPTVGLPSASSSSNSTYLLLMVDPDAPSPLAPGPQSEILHWLAPSLTAAGFNGTLSSSTPPVAPYMQPKPPSVEPHRYTLLLFTQKEQTFTLPAAFAGYGPQNRTSFDAVAFAKDAGLGEPIASTYFLTGNDTGTSGGGNGTSGNATSTGTGGAPIATGAGSRLNVLGLSAVLGVVAAVVGTLL